MSKQDATRKRHIRGITVLKQLALVGTCILATSSCAQESVEPSGGDDDNQVAHSNKVKNGSMGSSSSGADSDVAVASSAQPLTIDYEFTPKPSESSVPIYFQDIVDKIPQPVMNVLPDIKKCIDILSGVKDYASAGMAAAQMLGILDTPEPPATLSQVKAELDKLGAGLDWKSTQLWIDDVYGHVTAAMLAAGRCKAAGNCAADSAAWSANDNALAAILAMTTPDMAYCMRYNRASVTDGTWKNIIGDRPEVTSENYVFDWRGGVPYYLSYLNTRLATMALLDPAFSTTSNTFDSELRLHVDALTNYSRKMKEGVKCKIDTSISETITSWPAGCTGDTYCTPEQTCLRVAVGAWCADIYTGTSVYSYLGEWGCDVPESTFSAALETTRQTLYSKTPLLEMDQLINTLNFYLDKRHGYTIKDDFNHDSYSDILWYNPSQGKVGVWLLARDSVVRGSWIFDTTANGNLGWEIKGTGDFDHNGYNDILWHNPTTGQISVWPLQGDSSVSSSWNLNVTIKENTGWEIKGSGDFNRDGYTDILWWNPGSGQVGVWPLNGTGTVDLSKAFNFNLTANALSGWDIRGTGDFDRNGYCDILWWNRGTGTLGVWLLDGDNTVANTWWFDWTTTGVSGWEITGTGDYNRDGYIDILWHNAYTGQVGAWQLDGDNTVAGSWNYDTTTTGATGWEIATARDDFTKKDLNRDNFEDIILRDPNTGTLRGWLLDGDKTVGNTWDFDKKVASDWKLSGLGDFNRDGYTDVLWYRPVSGQVGYLQLDGDSTYVSTSYFDKSIEPNKGWVFGGVGDFNRDGFVDLLWHQPWSGLLSVWILNGTTSVVDMVHLDTVYNNWEVGGVGDFNRDGFIDILVRNPANGCVGVELLDGDRSSLCVNGTCGWCFNVPVGVESGWQMAGTGDYNRDGFTDIFWYHAASGTSGVWLLDGDSTVPDSWNYTSTSPGWDISSR